MNRRKLARSMSSLIVALALFILDYFSHSMAVTAIGSILGAVAFDILPLLEEWKAKNGEDAP